MATALLVIRTRKSASDILSTGTPAIWSGLSGAPPEPDGSDVEGADVFGATGGVGTACLGGNPAFSLALLKYSSSCSTSGTIGPGVTIGLSLSKSEIGGPWLQTPWSLPVPGHRLMGSPWPLPRPLLGPLLASRSSELLPLPLPLPGPGPGPGPRLPPRSSMAVRGAEGRAGLRVAKQGFSTKFLR